MVRVKPLLLEKLQSSVITSRLFITHSLFCLVMARNSIDLFLDAFLFLALPALLVLMQKKKTEWGKKIEKRGAFPTLTNENTVIFKCAKSNSFVKTVDRVFLNCRTKAAPQVAHFIPKKKKKLVKRSSLCCFFFLIWFLL